MLTSACDILYVDMKTKKEIDFDDQEGIGGLQNIIVDDKYFYVLANKRHGRLGYYLLLINVDNPTERIYLIQWVNKLDIGNCDMYVLTESGGEQGNRRDSKDK